MTVAVLFWPDFCVLDGIKREIGEHIGMKDKAVSFTCSSIRKRMEHDSDLMATYLAVLVKLGEDEI